MFLSADAEYTIAAGRAVYEQLLAENSAAMREMNEARTQIAALGDQIIRLQQANREANDRALRFSVAMNKLRELVDRLYGELLKQKHQAPVSNVEAIYVLAEAHGIDITKRKAAGNEH